MEDASMTQDISGSSEGILKTGMSEGAELEYLRGEVKDLSEKLETLRAKRQEDKQKLVDYERCKVQLQQLMEYKAKMTDQHSDLLRQLQEARKEAKEAVESREAHQEDNSDMNEAIEMATLDKEMAEEKAEMLQTELEAANERIQELEMDLEILKSDMQTPSDDAAVGVKLKQLEQHNERLKEALVKMRDVSGTSSSDNQRLTKECESLRSQVDEFSKSNDKMKHEIVNLEALTNDLQEQVDAALGSETMVEALTAKNLTLEEKVHEMEEALEDLEQMRVMDEEMQENARDAEKELRQELEMNHMKITELVMQLQNRADQMQDLDQTIGKFRIRTSELQEEIQDLKDQVLRAEAKATGDGSDGNTLTNYQSGKSFSEVVDNEVRKAEHDSSQLHSKYLKQFLPDNFGKPGGDNDGLLVTMLFPRLAQKATTLSRLLVEKYPSVPGGMRKEHAVKSHKAEQWGYLAKFRYRLNVLVTVAHKFQGALERCSVERLARLAQLQLEMTAQERLLDGYFELLKTNRLDENTSFDNLDRVVNYFQNIYSVHLVSDDYDGNCYMSDFLQQILSGTNWFKTNLERMHFYLLEAEHESDLGKLLKDLKLFITESESFCVRARNHLPDKTKKPVTLKFPEETLEHFGDISGHLEKATNLLHLACAYASTQVSMLPDVEGLERERLMEMFNEAGEKVFGRNKEMMAEDQLKISLGIVMSNVSKLADSLEKNEFETPIDEKKPFPALLERAQARKADAVEAEGLRWQLEKRDGELTELKRALRVKAEEIGELKLRHEMAEKRLHTNASQGDERLVRLQRQVDDLQQQLKKKDKEYEATLDALQKDIETMEQENAELKRRMKEVTRDQLLRNISRDAGLSTPTRQDAPAWGSTTGPSVNDSPLLVHQINTLKSALCASEHERWRLQGAEMQKIMASLTPLNVPKKPAGLTGLFDLDQSTTKSHGELAQTLREVNKLQQEYLEYTRNNRIIDLTKKEAGKVPLLEKDTPAYELKMREQKERQLKEWSVDLRARIQKMRAATLPSGGTISELSAFPTPAFSKTDGLRKVGRITLPTEDPSLAGKVIPVSVTAQQWNQMKAVLLY